MGFLDKLFNRTDINIAVEQFQATPGAFLIDVRTGPEYEAGHIEGAVNVPLNSIHFIVNHVRDINAPLYVYCQSGARSGQAVSMIREMGYKNVTNIGGVNRYKGKLVRLKHQPSFCLPHPGLTQGTLLQNTRFPELPPRRNPRTSFHSGTDP